MSKLTIWRHCFWPNPLGDRLDIEIPSLTSTQCIRHDTIVGTFYNSHLCHSHDTANSMGQLSLSVWLHSVHLQMNLEYSPLNGPALMPFFKLVPVILENVLNSGHFWLCNVKILEVPHENLTFMRYEHRNHSCGAEHTENVRFDTQKKMISTHKQYILHQCHMQNDAQ